MGEYEITMATSYDLGAHPRAPKQKNKISIPSKAGDEKKEVIMDTLCLFLNFYKNLH